MGTVPFCTCLNCDNRGLYQVTKGDSPHLLTRDGRGGCSKLKKHGRAALQK